MLTESKKGLFLELRIKGSPNSAILTEKTEKYTYLDTSAPGIRILKNLFHSLKSECEVQPFYHSQSLILLFLR